MMLCLESGCVAKCSPSALTTRRVVASMLEVSGGGLGLMADMKLVSTSFAIGWRCFERVESPTA